MEAFWSLEGRMRVGGRDVAERRSRCHSNRGGSKRRRRKDQQSRGCCSTDYKRVVAGVRRKSIASGSVVDRLPEDPRSTTGEGANATTHARGENTPIPRHSKHGACQKGGRPADTTKGGGDNGQHACDSAPGSVSPDASCNGEKLGRRWVDQRTKAPKSSVEGVGRNERRPPSPHRQ